MGASVTINRIGVLPLHHSGNTVEKEGVGTEELRDEGREECGILDMALWLYP